MLLDCGHEPSAHSESTTGYAVDSTGKKYCYDCAAKKEKAEMIKTGHACMYIGQTPEGRYFVSNWTGHNRFYIWKVQRTRKRFNIFVDGPTGLWKGHQEVDDLTNGQTLEVGYICEVYR